MRSGVERRLLLIAVLAAITLASCTTPFATPTPTTQEAPSPKPAAAGSPSPVAAASPTAPAPVASRQVVSGGAAQPRAAATFVSIGGGGLVIVPTPSFANAATKQPAPLAPAVSLQVIQPAPIVQVVGTLSRIPTAIPNPGAGGGGGGGGGANAAAAAGGGSGAATSLLTIGAVVTSTPLVRVQPQPTLAFPGAGR